MTAADVVVVGAGLAGPGRRPPAGGRRRRGPGAGGARAGRWPDLTLPTADGTPIDHGGHWIGPTQDRIAALAERVGVTTYSTYERGINIEFRDGRAHRYDGDILDGEDPVNAVAMGQAIRELEAMAATVPLEAPWAAAGALAWDSQTVETWLQARVSSERVRTWMREIIRGTLAAEARDAVPGAAGAVLGGRGVQRRLLCRILPPRVWTSFGQALREPVGRLHWAGTETATV